ncbi:MAG: hemerythrin family protein [Azonexus sp.]|nr:hemerythrin family protein [Azonexus sp.]MCK6413457.1 hemerythrin family protein [Azonexus sp.]
MDREIAVFLPEALVLDIDEIDEQHADLFARLAHLKEHCIEANGLPPGEGAALLEALYLHCATEERLAAESGLDFAEHIEKHRTMLSCIGHAIEQVLLGKNDAFSLIRYLEYWFERHIHDEDIILGERLHTVRGTPPCWQTHSVPLMDVRQVA